MIFEGSNLQFLMTLSAKTVIFDISVYMDFDWFLINFWGHLGPQTLPKISKKIGTKTRKFWYQFLFDFWWILEGFGRPRWLQNPWKIDQKTISKKWSKNESKKVMRGHARSRGVTRPGGSGSLKSIHPPHQDCSSGPSITPLRATRARWRIYTGGGNN